MNREEVLKFINDKLLDINNNFDGVYYTKKWFKVNGFLYFFDEINDMTNFLGKVRFREKLYCVIHNITEIKKCFCGKQIKFCRFNKGYLHTCGSKKCRNLYGYQVLDNGITRYQEVANKTTKTKMSNFTSEGITVAQASARKANKIVASRIVNGKNGHQIKMIKHIERLKNIIYEDGKNGYQKIAEKAEQTKRQKIIDGFNGYQRIHQSMLCVQDDGLTKYQKRNFKISQTKLKNIDENGNNGFRRIALLAAKTKKSKIDFETGLSIHNLQIQKANQTKLSDIDENGLNGFERITLKKGRCKRQFFKNTNLSYQGCLEKDFLEKLEEYDMYDIVHKAGVVQYVFLDNLHNYHPDFLLNQSNYFEIKSTWTYDKKGKDNDLRLINNLKWKSVLETKKDNRFFVVWDKKHIEELFLNDFEKLSIYDSFYLPDRLKEFNKQNLQSLLQLSLNPTLVF